MDARPAPLHELATARLTLRPLSDADVPALWPTVSQADFPRFMNWDAHRSQTETAAFVTAMQDARRRGEGLAWAIRHQGDFVGVVGLHGITRTERVWRVDRAELGYWITPAAQGRGFVTEAARAVLRCGFGTLGLHKITVGCIADNQASRRVIEKLGFRFLGEQREHLFRFGRWWNHLAYEMCVGEFPDAEPISA